MRNIINIVLIIILTQGISTKSYATQVSHINTTNKEIEKEYSPIISNDTIVNTTPSDNENTITSDPSSYIIDGENKDFTFIWNKRKQKRLSSHWSGFGMGFMNYNDKKIPNGTLKMSTSHNFTLNIMSYGKQLGHSNWLLVTGLGFDWSRYHFDTNSALTKVDGITRFQQAPDGINYKSTKLLAYYITIPLMLEYQSGGFHIAAGAVAFIKYYSKSQVKYYDEYGKHKVNMGKDLNIRPIDLRLKAQVGLDNVSLFGYYAPISMFKTDKGPDLKTYSVGVMIHF